MYFNRQPFRACYSVNASSHHPRIIFPVEYILLPSVPVNFVLSYLGSKLYFTGTFIEIRMFYDTEPIFFYDGKVKMASEAQLAYKNGSIRILNISEYVQM